MRAATRLAMFDDMTMVMSRWSFLAEESLIVTGHAGEWYENAGTCLRVDKTRM